MLLSLLCLLFSGVSCVVGLVAPQTVIPQPFSDKYGAACLDGSSPSFYILPQDPKRWVLFVEGGGWCFSTTTCAEHAATFRGSSHYPVENIDNFFGGILSPDPVENPRFYNYTLMFIHYCDGSSHTSDAILPLNHSGKMIYNRGRPNLQAQIMYQVETAGLGEAEEVILSGGSAGGTSTFLGLDYVRTLLPPSVRLVGAPDAGFFEDSAVFSNSSQYTFRDEFIAADLAVWNSTGAGNLNTHCLAAYSTEKWRCFFPQYAAPYIQTPFHVMMSAYDLATLSMILQLGCIGVTCSPDKLTAMLAWRGTFLDTLRPAVYSAPYNGAFITSCLVHEQNVDYCDTQSVPNCRGWNKYNVTAPGYAPQLSPQRGFSLWYDSLQSSWGEVVKVRAAWAGRVAESAGRGPLAHPSHVDVSATAGNVYIIDPLTWPSNPSCPWNGTGPPI